MSRTSKKYKKALEAFDREELHSVEGAVELLQKIAFANFNETVEIHIKLGIDPRKSDQTVRGTTVLPHGTGKTPKVIVFTKGDNVKACEEAGADLVGSDDLIQKVKDGFSDFDIAVASPDMMADVGRHLGRVLGPKMPNPRAGTVTPNVGQTVSELKSGKIQYRADKQAIIHSAVGKVQFTGDQLLENLKILIDAVIKAKPASAKGVFIRTAYLTSTMGPAIKVDPQKMYSFTGNAI